MVIQQPRQDPSKFHHLREAVGFQVLMFKYGNLVECPHKTPSKFTSVLCDSTLMFFNASLPFTFIYILANVKLNYNLEYMSIKPALTFNLNFIVVYAHRSYMLTCSHSCLSRTVCTSLMVYYCIVINQNDSTTLWILVGSVHILIRNKNVDGLL